MEFSTLIILMIKENGFSFVAVPSDPLILVQKLLDSGKQNWKVTEAAKIKFC